MRERTICRGLQRSNAESVLSVYRTLPEEKFAFYLVQDAHYLRQYSKVLAMLAARAPQAQQNITPSRRQCLCPTSHPRLAAGGIRR